MLESISFGAAATKKRTNYTSVSSQSIFMFSPDEMQLADVISVFSFKFTSVVS